MAALLPQYGCSQEDHVPNCGHFGMYGSYLSPHSRDCDHSEDSRYECTCNPDARKRQANADSRIKYSLGCYNEKLGLAVMSQMAGKSQQMVAVVLLPRDEAMVVGNTIIEKLQEINRRNGI